MSKIYAVGMGPGGREFFTDEAVKALEKADVIAGYTVYVDLVKDMFPEKETYTTSMKQEIERCRRAIEMAAGIDEKGNRTEPKDVAMVCSGDAGIYGMAGLLLELAEQYEEVEIEVVAGVTAALSGAAVLGAPVGHDLAIISLSDLLTSWDVIEKRLRGAAMGDFNICLYNPRSMKRRDHLTRACNILMETKSPDTVCGWVKNIGREGQEYKIVKLSEIPEEPIDMFTTVFIGSATTKVVKGRMVTPRGYEKKDGFDRGE